MPVCGRLEDGSTATFGNGCTACADPSVRSYEDGECPIVDEPSATVPELTACDPENRPEACTMEYLPVCGQVDTGIRCITTPCYTDTYRTFGNGCGACGSENVVGYLPGECEEYNFALCGQRFNDFPVPDGEICVAECPKGYDQFTTQVGLPECIPHYGPMEISQWRTCETANDCDTSCVLAVRTTDGADVPDAEFRCVPERYFNMMLFSSGATFLDENGQQATVIA